MDKSLYSGINGSKKGELPNTWSFRGFSLVFHVWAFGHKSLRNLTIAASDSILGGRSDVPRELLRREEFLKSCKRGSSSVGGNARPEAVEAGNSEVVST